MIIEWLYIVALIATLLINILIAAVSWSQKQTQTGGLFVVTILFSAGLTASYLFFSISKHEAEAFFWVRVRFLMLSLGPLFLFLFVASFTQNDIWIKPRRYLGLFVVPAITQIVVWLAPESFWQSWSIRPGHLINYEVVVFTGWFWVYTLQNYGLSIGAFVYLVQHTLKTPTPFKRQMWSLLAALVVVQVTALLPVLGLTPNLPNLFPISLSIVSLLLLWAVLKQGLLQGSPLTYHNIIEHMVDAAFVFNKDNRLILLNEAARQLLDNRDRSAIIGQTAAEVFLEAPTLVGQYADVWEAHFETTVTGDDFTQEFDVRISPLTGVKEVSENSNCLCYVTSKNASKWSRALRQSETLHRLLVEHSSDVIALMTHDLRYHLRESRR